MLREWAEPWRGERHALEIAGATGLAYFAGVEIGNGLAYAVSTYAITPYATNPSEWMQEWFKLLSRGVTFGVAVLLFLVARARLSSPDRRVSIWQARRGTPDWSWAIASAGIWLLLCVGAAWLSGGMSPLLGRIGAYDLDTWSILIVTALICVGVQAASEEIVVRGYLLPRLTVCMPPAFAVIVSSLAFTAFHSSMSLWGALGIFSMGVVLAISAWRTGSLMSAVGLHVANNVFMALKNPVNSNVDVGPEGFLKVIVAMMIWLACVEIRHRYFARRPATIEQTMT